VVLKNEQYNNSNDNFKKILSILGVSLEKDFLKKSLLGLKIFKVFRIGESNSGSQSLVIEGHASTPSKNNHTEIG